MWPVDRSCDLTHDKWHLGFVKLCLNHWTVIREFICDLEALIIDDSTPRFVVHQVPITADLPETARGDVCPSDCAFIHWWTLPSSVDAKQTKERLREEDMPEKERKNTCRSVKVICKLQTDPSNPLTIFAIFHKDMSRSTWKSFLYTFCLIDILRFVKHLWRKRFQIRLY